MLSRVLRTISRQQLLLGPDRNRVLCGVSGGADSMALLACLWELAPRLGLTIEVATVDHGLRAEAADEAALVRARAEALGLPWHRIEVDVRGARAGLGRGDAGGGEACSGDVGGGARSAGPAGRRGGVQEVARRLRLAALAGLAARRGLHCVALAHQADDQAETILFRIVRGTGIAGLAGIPYRRDPFIRPLLDVSRAEILRYLSRRSLPHVDDPSNRDLRYARARIRHQILPLLRGENPRVDEALRSLSAAAAARVWGEDGRIGPGGGAGGSGFAASAAWSAAGSGAARCAAAAGIHLPSHVAQHIDSIASEGRGTRSFDIGGGARLTVSYGELRVGPPPRGVDGGSNGASAIRVSGPGRYAFGSQQVVLVEAISTKPGLPPSVSPAPPRGLTWSWFDADPSVWPLSLRARCPGDRMRPRGGVGRRKLSDLLIDAKISRLERPHLPVIVAPDGEILFVPGLRPSQARLPTRGTRRWIGMAAGPFPDHDALVDQPGDESNTESVDPSQEGVPASR